MKSLKFFPFLCLLGFLLLSCDREAATSVSDGSWTASFRVASALTDSQLARATWVRVQASRSGVVVASDSAPYAARSVTLTIPSAGAVDIRLTGVNSDDTVMWTGSGTIASGVSNPGNVVTLVAGPGLLNSPTGTVAAPTFSVAGGTYTSAQTVTILSATIGASIYYTTDGTTPTATSTLYTGAITVSASKTITAIAVKSGWTSSAVSSATYTISSVTPTKRQYTLTVTQPTNGTIALNPTGGVYDSGSKVIATATASSGYTFSAWTGASTSTTSVCTLTVTKSVSLSASFTKPVVVKPQYTLTVTQPTNGTIALNPTGGVYDSGSKVIATATASSGYTFSAWTGASTSSVSVCTLTVTKNVSLSANFTSSSTPSTGDTGHFTDSRDNQSYKYVKIGSQTWMAQNLNYAGTSGSVGVCYNSLSSNCTTYGRLYTWSEVMSGSSSSTTIPSGVQGICPSGWHVPSDGEWTKLTDTTLSSSTSGTVLKAHSSLWSTNTGTDVYGFSVLPAGLRLDVGSFHGLGSNADFWSSSEGGASGAWYRYFNDGNASVFRYNDGKSLGFSVRCLEN